jgi:hypothetical protein
MTADAAIRLAQHFGMSPSFWLNLQANQGKVSGRQTQRMGWTMETETQRRDSASLAEKVCTDCNTNQPISEFAFYTDVARMSVCKTCLDQRRRAERRSKIDCVVGFSAALVGAFFAAWGGSDIGARLWSSYATWYEAYETPLPADSITAHERGGFFGMMLFILVFVLMLASVEGFAKDRRAEIDEVPSRWQAKFVLTMLAVLVLSIVG